jgi:hypothetical protein
MNTTGNAKIPKNNMTGVTGSAIANMAWLDVRNAAKVSNITEMRKLFGLTITRH